MRRVIVQCLFMMAFCANLALSQDGWFWQYPKPQGNILNDIHIFDENTAIAVGELGTIIKTTDGGNTWDVQHHAGGTSLPLYGVFFIDEKSGWAAGGTWWTDKNVLLKTEDGGITWKIVETHTDEYALPFQGVYFVSADTGFVFGEDGLVLRTTDGGATWNSQIIGFELHRLNSACFLDKETGWIVGYGFYGNTIFKTTDCGLTWEQQSLETRVFNQTDVQFIDDSTGFIVGQMGTFLKTTDGGQTWEYHDLFEKYQDAEYQYSYSVFFVNADTGWIAGGDYYGYILKTIDGGENWFEEKRIPECHFYKIRFSDQENGWAVGLYGFIYHTTDGCANWIPQRDEIFDEYRDSYFIDENTGWVVGGGGSIINTKDGGDSWDENEIANDLSFFSVIAIDFQKIIAVGAQTEGVKPAPVYMRKAAITRTIDGGQTWTTQIMDTIVRFNSVSFPSSEIGWVVGSKGAVLKTIDGGKLWESQNLDIKSALRQVFFINERIGWILTGNMVLKTIDGGKTWGAKVVNSEANLFSFCFINENIGWVVGEYQAGLGLNIFTTTDGGESWSSSELNQICRFNSVYFLDENEGWIVGGYSGEQRSFIFKTSDGGNTWLRQNSPSSEGLNSVFFINKKTGWTVGNGIFKTTSGGGSAVDDTPEVKSSQPVNIALSNNYPNPFNASTVISFKLATSGHVNLSIYDLLGRKVETLVNKTLSAGEHKVKWQVGDRASGVYLCRLQMKNNQEARKMLLMR